MELDDIKDLIRFLKDTDVTEVSIESDGTKVKLKREQIMTPFELSGVPMAEPVAAPPAVHDDAHRLITITAPLVGTFYRSPTPEAGHFVEPGDKVKKGQVICIIEAMKLMNEIEAEADGTVVKVLVENSQPVEYGEPLFLLEP